MTREEVIRLAKEAGIKLTPFTVDGEEYDFSDVEMDSDENLFRFAELVAAEYKRDADKYVWPKMKKVRMLCWINSRAELVWREESWPLDAATRIPAQDIEIEIPEGV